MAKKGQKQMIRTENEKYEIIKPIINNEKSQSQVSRETGINIGLIFNWVKKYNESGIEGLKNKTKPGNPLMKYSRKKELTKEEQLEYENMKLRIENELLKKGYLTKGDGSIVKFMK
ncbi:MAG TPA: helix-turn-helix domain-containing protein [Bacilli bacterium]|nr:helix-turn-helix domain-containing protein [Bacilli bacterium]